MRKCIADGRIVIDLGTRAIVENELAAEVVALEGMRIEDGCVLGEFAWIPVGALLELH